VIHAHQFQGVQLVECGMRQPRFLLVR
jgi:hypothetical protein